MNIDDRPYTTSEMMVWCLSNQIVDEEVAQVGAFTPLALVAALAAKRTHAPGAAVYPIGPAGVEIESPFPATIGMLEACTLGQGTGFENRQIIDRMQSEGVPFEPISAAQIDQYGNLNLSRVQTSRGELRLPGAAGLDALYMMMATPLLLYTTRHSPRVLVEHVEFVTGVGQAIRGADRKELAVPGPGARRLISDLCIMAMTEDGRFEIETIHPGVELSNVVAKTGFDLRSGRTHPETSPPSEEFLDVVRDEIDPLRLRDLEFRSARERRAELLRILNEEGNVIRIEGS